MHTFVGADDGIHRTGLNAQGTADAVLFVDAGNPQRARQAARQVQRNDRAVKQRGQRGDARFAAGRASVDARCPIGNRLGIRPATVKPAFCALGLGKAGVDAVSEVVHGTKRQVEGRSCWRMNAAIFGSMMVRQRRPEKMP